MSDVPCAREKQYEEIKNAIMAGVKLIVATGPVSTGKTTVIEALCKDDTLPFQKIHVFCDSQMPEKMVYINISEKINKNAQTPKSFKAFVSMYENNGPTVVFIDSFHLLDSARDLYSTLSAAIDNDLIPNFTFVFVARSTPTNFTSYPMNLYPVDFPGYSIDELVQITVRVLPSLDNEEAIERINKIIDTAQTTTKDVRDIIFITHKLMKTADTLSEKEFFFGVVKELREMRAAKVVRVSNLPKLGKAILLASYIAMKTNVQSDLLRLTRASKRTKRITTFSEHHELVPLERILAIAKSLIYHHIDNFEADFAVNIQISNLVELGLLELRGDIRGDPKAKCLATDAEVVAAAKTLHIDLSVYTSEQ